MSVGIKISHKYICIVCGCVRVCLSMFYLCVCVCENDMDARASVPLRSNAPDC